MTVPTKRGVGRPRKNSPTAVAAAAKSVQNRYDAAGTGKRMAGWNPPSTGPNKALTGLNKITDRARDLQRNDWTGASITQKWGTALIGIGIRARVTRIKDAKRKEELNDLWWDFCEQCDADGVLNFFGQQTLGVATWTGDGEIFIRRRARRPDSDLAVPLQIQLIESNFVPLLDMDTYQGLPPGNKIRSGIEFDNRGQRIAYWMYREHPGDGFNVTIDPSKLLRIPAADVVHMYQPKRAGQLRGVSELAPIIPQVRDIGDYRDSVLTRQKLANLFVLFLTRKLGADEDDVDPLSGKAIQGTFDEPLQPLAPGLVQELEDGQDVKFANPPEAGTTFSDYMRTELLGPAAATGLPYELFSGDIKDISDRTLRVIINEFRRLAEQKQWQIVIPMMCQRVRNWFAEAALLAGKISIAEFDDVRRVEWAPHGWAYIHPVQDPQGKQIETKAGFRSRSSVIAERGDDPEVVDQERADDQEREQRLELFVDPTGNLDATGQPIQPDHPNANDGPTPPTALQQALERRANAEADLLRARAEQARNPAPPNPTLIAALEREADLAARIVKLLEPELESDD